MKHRRLLTTCLAAYWALIFTVTHIPAQKLPDTHVSDKVEHFVAYLILTILLYLNAWIRNISALRASMWIAGIGMIYGALDELLQIPVNRHADVHDWIADMSGVMTGLLLMNLIRHLKSSDGKPVLKSEMD